MFPPAILNFARSDRTQSVRFYFESLKHLGFIFPQNLLLQYAQAAAYLFEMKKFIKKTSEEQMRFSVSFLERKFPRLSKNLPSVGLYSAFEGVDFTIGGILRILSSHKKSIASFALFSGLAGCLMGWNQDDWILHAAKQAGFPNFSDELAALSDDLYIKVMETYKVENMTSMQVLTFSELLWQKGEAFRIQGKWLQALECFREFEDIKTDIGLGASVDAFSARQKVSEIMIMLGEFSGVEYDWEHLAKWFDENVCDSFVHASFLVQQAVVDCYLGNFELSNQAYTENASVERPGWTGERNVGNHTIENIKSIGPILFCALSAIADWFIFEDDDNCPGKVTSNKAKPGDPEYELIKFLRTISADGVYEFVVGFSRVLLSLRQGRRQTFCCEIGKIIDTGKRKHYLSEFQLITLLGQKWLVETQLSGSSTPQTDLNESGLLSYFQSIECKYRSGLMERRIARRQRKPSSVPVVPALLDMQAESAPPRTIYVGDAKEGTLLRLPEWRKMVMGKSLLKIFNATPSPAAVIAQTGQAFARPISFSCIAMSREMPVAFVQDTLNKVPDAHQHAYASQFAFVLAAADQRGHPTVRILRHWLVARTGVSAVCMSFNSVRRREIILGLSDNSIHCYNIDTDQLVARLPAYHRSEPAGISVHPSKAFAISNSRTESIIWDTEKWERKRVLMGSGPATGDAIITAFNDGSILIWDSETFGLRWKITLENILPTKDDPSWADTRMLIPRISQFSVSHNEELMAYCGLSSSIYVWNLFEKRLLHEILIPAFKKTVISQIEFIGTSTVAAVLSSTGQLMFVDTENAKMLGQFKGRHLFRSFALSHDGALMSVILMDAKYSVRLIRIDYMINSTLPKTEQDLEDLEHSEDGGEKAKRQTSPKRVNLQAEQAKTFYEMIEAKEDTSLLNRRRLLKYLKHYENREAYETLLEKNIHPSIKDFRKKFPLKSDRISKSMERTLSCLAHWSPIFEDLDYLPSIVFPFVKLFANDMFSGFEVIMTVLTNWCQKWWEYYPNPPIECLGVLENLLAYHDAELISHFINNKITSQVYGWAMMQSLFTEITSKSDWLKSWDHFVTNPPAFMYYFMCAYLMASRTALLAAQRTEDYQYFFSRVNPVSIDKVIISAYRLHSETPDEHSPVIFFESFKPLMRGQYAIFNKYPEFIVNYQSKMKEKIRADEKDYLRKRKIAADLSKLTDDLKGDKKAWENADWKMNDIVEKWWQKMMGKSLYLKTIRLNKTIEDVEDSHNDRVSRLDAIEKEQRAKTLRRIAEARKGFLDHQTNSTHLHALSLAKAVGVNRKDFESKLDTNNLDEKFDAVENEWMARKEELARARHDLAKLDEARTERLVKNLHIIGTPTFKEQGFAEAAVSETNENISDAPQSHRLREALKQGLRDPSFNPTRLKPRAWSPEMTSETAHRVFTHDDSIASEAPSPTRQSSPPRSADDAAFFRNLTEELERSPTRSVRFE
ncbi:TBC1 domain member 31 [Entophlyctis sp. JEL0112]|nr:TBC1 domain member 31 [Entophlyctis sp. JEL0112]